MSPDRAWILGGGGLLGSHFLKALQAEAPDIRPWNPGESGIPWAAPDRVFEALTDQASRFANEVALGAGGWVLVWCAGSGVIGSRAEELAQETGYLSYLLNRLGKALPGRQGKVLLASSAGGVFGGCGDHPLTERSICAPASEYGQNKLRQERILLEWVRNRPQVSTLIARISNLYGPGQDLAKPQGLIAHISRSILHRVPVHIYVPLDTQRDYVYVEDCAKDLVRSLLRLGQTSREDVIKIFHSSEVVTIAGVIAAFSRIAKGHPRIICSHHPVSAQQPLQLQFRSMVWPDITAAQKTSFAVGIQRVHAHLFSLFQKGKLPPPSQHR